MKRAVLQFTACVLAAGMTVSGTGIAAFAAKDDALAGFGGTAVQSVSGSTAEDTQESQTWWRYRVAAGAVCCRDDGLKKNLACMLLEISRRM